MVEVKIIKDSTNQQGDRITTFQLKYWRAIHGELMTHRVFSRNASSSRAIPVKKMLAQVWNDPAMPIHWGQNQAGMQAKSELTGLKLRIAKSLWKGAGRVACAFAWGMTKVGLHKQVANRLLEPWQYIHVVLTATEFDNWFELRDHEDAQPEIQELAAAMRQARTQSTPVRLLEGEWHLPYTEYHDASSVRLYINEVLGVPPSPGLVTALLARVSAARCCRVSTLKHDGTEASIKEDLDLCERLAGARPIHASPFEHQALADIKAENGSWSFPHLHGNFKGFVQFRKIIESECH